ncbi:MAG: peptidylprolyl isomerase [Planctomycetaceae bacterium]|nr:peptidylprolyl isomerase [Planctomycetaceae bacterium]
MKRFFTKFEFARTNVRIDRGPSPSLPVSSKQSLRIARLRIVGTPVCLGSAVPGRNRPDAQFVNSVDLRVPAVFEKWSRAVFRSELCGFARHRCPILFARVLRYTSVAVGTLLLALLFCRIEFWFQQQRKTVSFKSKVEEATKDVDFAKHRYQITLDTSAGKIVLDLLPEKAPGHCINMIGLARSGFYDKKIFHRIIKGFMIQGGCPQGSGTGGPGYQIPAEFNDLPHVAGVLSMARSSNPNSAGSQFFICLDKHTHLDGQYTAFGRTADESSLAVVKSIGSVATLPGDRPKADVVIKTATVAALPV